VRVQVSLLGGFDFAAGDGTRPALAPGAQRLVAYLALHDHPVPRPVAAGSLWPEADHERAASSLRTALSRLDASVRDAVTARGGTLSLSPEVAVDVRDSRSLAQALLDRGDRAADARPEAIGALSHDILPDWYDEWVVPDAEAWRQLRISALEALSDRLTQSGRFAHAMLAAVAAAHVEPLRERSTAAVIRVHLAEGNRAAALRELGRYRALVQRELGAEPTDALYELVGIEPGATRRRGDGHPDVPKWDEVHDVRARLASLRRPSRHRD
jgi:DNA-binding SARP family transcriptional activator